MFCLISFKLISCFSEIDILYLHSFICNISSAGIKHIHIIYSNTLSPQSTPNQLGMDNQKSSFIYIHRVNYYICDSAICLSCLFWIYYGVPGWLNLLSIQLLISTWVMIWAQVMISGSQDRTPCQALCSVGILLETVSLSQINQSLGKKLFLLQGEIDHSKLELSFIQASNFAPSKAIPNKTPTTKYLSMTESLNKSLQQINDCLLIQIQCMFVFHGPL